MIMLIENIFSWGLDDSVRADPRLISYLDECCGNPSTVLYSVAPPRRKYSYPRQTFFRPCRIVLVCQPRNPSMQATVAGPQRIGLTVLYLRLQSFSMSFSKILSGFCKYFGIPRIDVKEFVMARGLPEPLLALRWC